MSQHQRHNQTIRKIVLPSGREIEVVRLADAAPPHQIGVCTRCGCECVQPVSWNERQDGRWDLTLECPNCTWIERGTYTRTAVEQLEERLDEGVATMVRDLKQLAHANMTADIERFIAALRNDVILPEDF